MKNAVKFKALSNSIDKWASLGPPEFIGEPTSREYTPAPPREDVVLVMIPLRWGGARIFVVRWTKDWKIAGASLDTVRESSGLEPR